MQLSDLAGKRICILGFGREGQAVLRALSRVSPKPEVTVADKSSEAQAEGCTLQTGERYLENLERFDVIVKSPGIPPNPELRAVTEKITNATQIFLDTVAAAGSTVIGVTGSKGKSTTSSLIAEILREAGRDVHLVGNIGVPALDFTNRAGPQTIFVHEMSSYQLMDMSSSPSIAVITSFFPEHLDYHGSLEAYREAKEHIVTAQRPVDTVVFCAASEGAAAIASKSPGRKVPYMENDAPVTLAATQLIGEHNLRNIAGAWTVCRILGVEETAAVRAIKAFKGLPHRLQSLGVHGGIELIDDAISTTPESTIAALDALGDRVATIILGGQDRGNDFTGLAERMKETNIRTIILFPGSGPRIREALNEAKIDATIIDSSSMEEAIEIARSSKSNAQSPMPAAPVCLLSTASPSYNMFKNFEAKGDEFSRCVHELFKK